MSDENRNADRNYDVFLHGETIDLVIPSEGAIDLDEWHNWFNDPDFTEFSDYGLFPNTAVKQRRFLEEVRADENCRIVLMIRPKGVDHVVGVASLSKIHPIHRSAETSVMIANRKNPRGSMFWGLESKALLTIHGFETLGLERIGGAQAMPLAEWQRIQTIFGYRPEGIKRNAHRRGYRVFDSVLSSCTLADYLKVKEARAGHYWPGKERLLEMIRTLPNESIAEQVRQAIDKTVEAYMAKVDLE